MNKRLFISKILIGLGALSVLVVALACGGGEQEDAVTKEELRAVVQEAMAASAPEPAPAPTGPSAEEMRAMVSEAVAAAAPDALSGQEIGAMVEAAVMAMSADAVSGEDIERLVASAVEEAVSQGPYPPEQLGDRGHSRCGDCRDSDAGGDWTKRGGDERDGLRSDSGGGAPCVRSSGDRCDGRGCSRSVLS